MTMPAPICLRVAVCLFPEVEALDYQGPISMLGFLAPEPPIPLPQEPKFALTFTYLAPSIDPVSPASGPAVVPDETYEEFLKKIGKGEDAGFDILWVPGGPGASPNVLPAVVLAFVTTVAPIILEKPNGYVLSVCTGAWILARAGVLDGKCSTTNKAKFDAIKGSTSDRINWVSHARWVVESDKRLWTSSGVTAGMDMAAAFCQHLVGESITRAVRGTIELSNRCKDQDEFADFWRLDYISKRGSRTVPFSAVVRGLWLLCRRLKGQQIQSKGTNYGRTTLSTLGRF